MKLKSYLIIFLLFTFFTLTYAQVTDAEKKLRSVNADTVMGWKTGGVFAVNLAQTSLTNWAAGGQNSFAVNGILSVFANLRQGKSSWDNSLDLGYGLLKQGKDAGLLKTDDKFDFTSKYGREAFKNFNTVLLYDDNIKVPVDRNGNGIFESTEAPGPRTQFKEILGVGFSYKF